MSSTSSHLKASFEPDNLENRFSRLKEMEAGQDLSRLSPQRSPQTSSESRDDEAAACADDPLADAKSTAK